MYGYGCFISANGRPASGAVLTSRTTAFKTATGITDATILNALNTLDLGLISNGLDSKIKALYPFVGGTATKHSYNLINTSNYQITWYGGMTHDSNGITGNGSNAYGNTNFNNNLITSNNSAFGVYSKTNIDGTYAYMGSRGTTSSISILFPRLSNVFKALSNGWYTNYQDVSNTSSLGFFQSVRTSSTNVVSLKNSTASSFTITTAGTNDGNFCLLQSGINNGSSNEYITPANLAFAYIGEGMTSTDAVNLNSLVQTFQSTLGR